MSIKVRLNGGLGPAVPLLLDSSSSGSPAAPEPLPPGVVRVACDPLPELPAKVAAFWFHQEAEIPPWRRESDSDRDRRRYLESLGIWTG